MKNKSHIGILLLLTGCVQQMDHEVRDRLMQESLDRRLVQYRQVQHNLCREEVLQEAILMVDSIYRENPILIDLDTLDRPARPLRPETPEFALPENSTPLRPIIPITKESPDQ